MIYFLYWILFTVSQYNAPMQAQKLTDNGGGAELKTYNPLDYTTGDFMQIGEGPCPAQGRGRNARFNVYKNRDIPPTHYTTMSVANILMLTDNDTTAYQRRGVSIEGYFIGAKKEGAESCNCFSTVYVDDHAWLIDSIPEETTTKALARYKEIALTTEISPRLHGSDRTRDQNYNHNVINKLARAHIRVRVSGWLMWDGPEQRMISRGQRPSIWEIHPIHSIEVKLHSKWQPLDSLDAEAVSSL